LNVLIPISKYSLWLQGKVIWNEYMAIKELEGEIINYVFKVKIAEEGSSLIQQETDALRLDNLISVVRNCVYPTKATKAPKDAVQDFESFHIIDNRFIYLVKC